MSWFKIIWFKPKSTKGIGTRKTSFRKEIAQNTDFHKPVLNKIITTQEYVKYDFVTPLNAPLLRGIFVDSFNMLYDYLRYLLQSINPFDTSVLERFSQVKISKKTFFLRLLRKVPYNLILIWRIQKSNSFSQIFSFSSSFLPRFIKNVLKNGSKFFSIDFHEKFPIT